VLRVADLGEEQRSGELGERVAETHEETGALKHGQVDGGGLDRGGDDHDGATDDDGHTTAVVIRDEGNDGKRDERTDLVHGAETTEGHTGGSVHVGDPGREELHGVQHRTIVTSGGRGNTEDSSVEVELPHVGRLLPVDPGEDRGRGLYVGHDIGLGGGHVGSHSECK